MDRFWLGTHRSTLLTVAIVGIAIAVSVHADETASDIPRLDQKIPSLKIDADMPRRASFRGAWKVYELTRKSCWMIRGGSLFERGCDIQTWEDVQQASIVGELSGGPGSDTYHALTTVDWEHRDCSDSAPPCRSYQGSNFFEQLLLIEIPALVRAYLIVFGWIGFPILAIAIRAGGFERITPLTVRSVLLNVTAALGALIAFPFLSAAWLVLRELTARI